MIRIDGVIVARYVAAALAAGFCLARRRPKSLEDDLASAGWLPRWLAATSTAATMFSIDARSTRPA